MTLENIGIGAALLLALLGVAFIGGAIVYRFKSGGEREAIDSYRNAVEGYQAEVGALTMKNERLEAEMAALRAKNEAEVAGLKRENAAQGEQLKSLSLMVQGVEAIASLETRLNARFESIHAHLNRLHGEAS